jgi:hypothetical protein
VGDLLRPTAILRRVSSAGANEPLAGSGLPLGAEFHCAMSKRLAAASPFEDGAGAAHNERSGVDAGSAVCLRIGRPRPGATHRER